MLLYISIFTIVLSIILLLFNWKINRNAAFLACVFIIFSIYGIAHYFVIYGQNPFWLAVFYNNFTPLMLVAGPFLYFYVRGTLLDTEKLCHWDYVHFIPALVHLMSITPYLFSPFEYKLKIAQQLIHNLNAITTININLFYSPAVSYSIRAVSVLLYTLYCIYLSIKYLPLAGKNSKNIPRKQLQITTRWLGVLLSAILCIIIGFLIVTYNCIETNPSTGLEKSYTFYIITGSAYSILSFSLLLFPDVLYGIPKRVATEKHNKKKTQNEKKTGEIAIEKDPFYELSKKIIHYLEDEKPFLDTEFSISDIALHLKAPQNHISYCINSIMNTKFSKLKSDLRVNYALYLLGSEMKNSLTIEAIGEKSGFKTRSNFYAAFKDKTGVSPSEYLERNSLDAIVD